MDDDCRPDPSWTYELVMSFIQMHEAIILSGMTYAIGDTEFDKIHDKEGTLNGRKFIDEDFLLYGPTCNLSVTRTVANTLAFDTSYPEAACEDVDFCLRALQNGYKICHAPSRKVLHDYGYGDYCCNAKTIMKRAVNGTLVVRRYCRNVFQAIGHIMRKRKKSL